MTAPNDFPTSQDSNAVSVESTDLLGFDDDLVMVRCWYCDAGCDECDNTGYLHTDRATAGRPPLMKDTPSQQPPLGGSDHRLVRALRRCKKDGWPRCPKCGKRMRPNMGTMRSHGIRGPQLWACDQHFLPSYYGTAQSVIETHCSPNAE